MTISPFILTHLISLDSYSCHAFILSGLCPDTQPLAWVSFIEHQKNQWAAKPRKRDLIINKHVFPAFIQTCAEASLKGTNKLQEITFTFARALFAIAPSPFIIFSFSLVRVSCILEPVFFVLEELMSFSSSMNNSLARQQSRSSVTSLLWAQNKMVWLVWKVGLVTVFGWITEGWVNSFVKPLFWGVYAQDWHCRLSEKDNASLFFVDLEEVWSDSRPSQPPVFTLHWGTRTFFSKQEAAA